MRQLFTENMLIAVAGGVAGVLLARWTRHLLVAIAPQDIPRLAETGLDFPVLLFASVLSLTTGLIFGMAPVITASRIDLSTALKAGARTLGGDEPRQYARSVLVVGEVALTFVLVFGAGLLLRSLIAAQNASPGVNARPILSLELRLPGSSYTGADAIGSFYTRLAGELRAIPGVTGVTGVRCPPGAGTCGDWFYSIPGRAVPARNEVPIALFNIAEPGYFRTMQVAVRQGREFNETDRAAGQKVAIVNDTFARTWWPSEPAVGHQIKMGGPYIDGPLFEVVGVVADVKQNGLDSQPLPEVYQPFAQKRDGAMAVMIRTAGDRGPGCGDPGLESCPRRCGLPAPPVRDCSPAITAWH